MTYSMTDSSLKTAAEHVGADVSQALAGASAKAGDVADAAKRSAIEGFDKVESAIRRNPLAAASIAGGVGFFLAVLARR